MQRDGRMKYHRWYHSSIIVCQTRRYCCSFSSKGTSKRRRPSEKYFEIKTIWIGNWNCPILLFISSYAWYHVWKTKENNSFSLVRRRRNWYAKAGFQFCIFTGYKLYVTENGLETGKVFSCRFSIAGVNTKKSMRDERWKNIFIKSRVKTARMPSYLLKSWCEF